jgi:hypothetical protein
MQRMTMVLAMLGLVVSVALPAGAAEVTLFGTKYNVVSETRAQTYKNGLTVTLPEANNRKACLSFVQGADPSRDRLFVGCPMAGSETGTHLYVLTGADANGVFSKDAATMDPFFGASVDAATGGRPYSILYLNDVNTGPKADRNFAALCLDGNDSFNFFDINPIPVGPYTDNSLLRIEQPSIGGENPDPGMPFDDGLGMAPGPNGTLVMIGRAEGLASIEIGVMDPKQDKFFNVKTDLVEATKDSVVKLDPPEQEPNALVRITDTEYWMIASATQAGDTDDTEYQYLYRLELTFPPDLAKAAPGSIKAKVLARESLLGTPLHASPGGVFGMAVGREVPGGRRFYFADWQGNLYTATPVP